MHCSTEYGRYNPGYRNRRGKKSIVDQLCPGQGQHGLNEPSRPSTILQGMSALGALNFEMTQIPL